MSNYSPYLHPCLHPPFPSTPVSLLLSYPPPILLPSLYPLYVSPSSSPHICPSILYTFLHATHLPSQFPPYFLTLSCFHPALTSLFLHSFTPFLPYPLALLPFSFIPSPLSFPILLPSPSSSYPPLPSPAELNMPSCPTCPLYPHPTSPRNPS